MCYGHWGTGKEIEELSEKEVIRDSYWAAETQAREAPWRVVPGLQSFFAAVCPLFLPECNSLYNLNNLSDLYVCLDNLHTASLQMLFLGYFLPWDYFR